MKKKAIIAIIVTLVAIFLIFWPPVDGFNQTYPATETIEVPIVPIQPPNDSIERVKRAEVQIQADRLSSALAETERRIKMLQRMKTAKNAKPIKKTPVAVVSVVKVEEKKDSVIEKPTFFEKIQPRIRISFGRAKEKDCE